MSYSHFTLAMRSRLESLHSLGKSLSECARLLGVHRSTVKRELERNGYSKGLYIASEAHRWAMKRKKRPEGNRSPRRICVTPRYGRILDPFTKPAKRIFIGEDDSIRLSRERRNIFGGLNEFRKPLTASQRSWRRRMLKMRLRLHDWENRWRKARDWHTIHMFAQYRKRYTTSCVSCQYRIEFPAKPVLSRTYHGPLNLLRPKMHRPLLGWYRTRRVLGDEYVEPIRLSYPRSFRSDHKNPLLDQEIPVAVKLRRYYPNYTGTIKTKPVNQKYVSGQSQNADGTLNRRYEQKSGKNADKKYAGKNTAEINTQTHKICIEPQHLVSLCIFYGVFLYHPFIIPPGFVTCFVPPGHFWPDPLFMPPDVFLFSVLPGRYFMSAVFFGPFLTCFFMI